MKLHYLKLKNFRQFYGATPKIAFAKGKKNITVLHANNGSGKTALLNAFIWTMFDSYTPGFQLPEQIVNKRAIREATPGDIVEAWVELKFSHDGSNYVIKRAQEAVCIEDEPGWQNRSTSNATLQKESGSGNWRPIERVDDEIGRVLPKDLHNYFFFDGERIERIVRPSKKQQEEIKAAAKKLLGLEIVARGKSHLDKVRKKFEKDLQDTGDEELTALLKDKEKLENEKQQLASDVEENEVEIEHNQTRKKEIADKLLGHREIKSIQERRQFIEKEKDIKNADIAEYSKNLKQEISKHGYSVFINKLITNFREQVDRMREKGELPSGIKKQFVEDLLEKHKCICGTELIVGHPAHEKVKQWRQQAGLADVEEKALSMGGELKNYEAALGSFPTTLESLKTKIRNAYANITEFESELDDISDKLRKFPKEEIAGLEKQLSACEEKEKTLLFTIADKKARTESIKKKIIEIDKAIGKKQSEEEKQDLLLRRGRACRDAYNRLSTMLTLWDKRFRIDLEQKMQDLFSQMTLTPYLPQITESYGIVLKEAAGGKPLDVAASQGENQILSLAFIGSIIEVVRNQKQQHDTLAGGVDASSYPVVMDSPFGALDHNYRRQIAKILPNIAGQVVTLVTKTQWHGEVENAMMDKIGREYILTYYTPRDDVAEDLLEINGAKYPLIRQSTNGYEYTVIEEL
jgi:DNA sulfur modification protein DndD